jgi:NADPH:quinone reductase-like Zn-dependent oxidoreductase
MAGTGRMKAIAYYRYGRPDVLELEEVPKPGPGDNEVLVKVRAASVNALDWHLLRGTPYIGRLAFGLRRPKNTRPGRDVAGVVEAVGRNVTQFQPGDEVFGCGRGTFADYVCASESALVTKPGNVSFEQAAAVPIAAMTALQGLRDKGRIQAGQKVLINGATGGVGTFAVQIAKAFGADVTGVCSTRNLDLVRSIGADRVIDYTQEDFTRGTDKYDLIFDVVGNHSFAACRRVLHPNGIAVAAGGGGVDGRRLGRWMARLLTELLLSKFVSQTLVICGAKLRKEDLAVLRGFLEAGKVTPVIDRRYVLAEAPQALDYFAQGHARGKVVISV